jgi:hypothetical protein
MEVIDAVREFLSLIGGGPGSPEPTPDRLERSLDRLAYVQRMVTGIREPADAETPPGVDYRELRAAVAARFPDLGCYRLPSPILRLGEGEIEVADAVDDLTEIASALKDVVWCLEHLGLEGALWQFRQGYASHWRERLRGLQFHLLSPQTPAAAPGHR